MTAAAKEVGADRNTVRLAQCEQTLYGREQLQSLGTLAITCLKQAMMDTSDNLNLRAAVVVLDRIIKAAPAQPELAGQPHARNPAVAQSRTTDQLPVTSTAHETPEPHKLHNHAQPNQKAGLPNQSAPAEKLSPRHYLRRNNQAS